MEAGLLSPRSASRELDSIMDELLLDLEMGVRKHISVNKYTVAQSMNRGRLSFSEVYLI